MKKLFIGLFILLLFIGGWGIFTLWQIQIPANSTGVVITKTSGVLPTALRQGDLFFSWELLLPTNVTVAQFPDYHLNEAYEIAGFLPSGKIYGDYIGNSEAFSFNAKGWVKASIDSKALPGLVKSTGLTPEKWNIYIAQEKEKLLNKITYWLETRTENTLIFQVPTTSLTDSNLWTEVEVNLSKIDVPDRGLYSLVQKEFQENQILIEKSRGKVFLDSRIFDEKETKKIELLRKYGLLIKDFPQVLDLWKLSTEVPELKQILPGVQ